MNSKDERYFDYYTRFVSKYLRLLPKGSKVLEIGCGDGLALSILAKKFRSLTFVGIDISNIFVSYAKKYRPSGNLRFQEEDSMNLSFGVNTFDAVISTDVVEHIPNVPKWLEESRRVLKKKGILVVVTGNHFSPIQQLCDIFTLRSRPPFANSYFYQFPLLAKNVYYSIIKHSRPEFIYVKPDLSTRADKGGDFDAVYLAHPFDIATYIQKKKMTILNVTFKGKSLASRIIGRFPSLAGLGIVAQK